MRKEIINEARDYIRDNDLSDLNKVLEAFAEDNLTEDEVEEIENLIFEYEDEKESLEADRRAEEARDRKLWEDEMYRMNRWYERVAS